MIQTKDEQASFSYKRSLEYTIHICKNADIENMFRVLFYQVSEDMHILRFNATNSLQHS